MYAKVRHVKLNHDGVREEINGNSTLTTRYTQRYIHPHPTLCVCPGGWVGESTTATELSQQTMCDIKNIS